MHPSNAPSPMLVTLSGILMDVRPLHLENALFPMLVTLSGIIVFLHPAMSLFDAFSMIALHSFRESYFLLFLSTTMLVRLLHLENALFPMLVTLPGILMDVRLKQ